VFPADAHLTRRMPRLRRAGPNFAGPIEPPRPGAQYNLMAEYSYLVLYLPRGMSPDAARRILTDHAEYGDWELARLRLNADGSRKATLRRQIIRSVRTL
jgi:Family of unknown function (DUF5703)